jgi:hypothetical protein
MHTKHTQSHRALAPFLPLIPLLLLTLSTTLSGQGGAPAKEMARLDKMVGNWEGSGEFWMSPDEEGQPWTSRWTAKKVLGGHFLREDMIIDLGEPMGSLAFVSFKGWDAAEKRYGVYTVSNGGELTKTELVWLSDDTTLTLSTTFHQGHHGVERWVNKISGDTLTMQGDTATENGAFFTHVKGTAKKVANAKPVSVAGTGAFMGMEPPEEMSRIARCKGDYTFTGSYRMSPDQEPVPIEGKETANALFGGMAVEFLPTGEGYEGYHAIAWDARKERYVSFGLDSWGMAHWVEGWWADDRHVVMTCNALMMGKPTVMRSVLQVNDKGQLVKVWSHAISSVAEPYRSFDGAYEGPKTKGE